MYNQIKIVIEIIQRVQINVYNMFVSVRMHHSILQRVHQFNVDIITVTLF